MLAVISLETINQFMVKYKKLKGESINQKQALFLAGFDIQKKYLIENQLIRSELQPSKVKEGLVIRGYARNKVKCLEDGKLVYSEKAHPMKVYYSEGRVVTGKAVLDNLVNITDIGDYDPSNPKNKG